MKWALPSPYVIQYEINQEDLGKSWRESALINSFPSCMIKLLKIHRVEEMSASIIITCETDMLSF